LITTQRLSLKPAPHAADVDAKAAMHRTAHISLRPEAIEDLAGPTPTRRKTIRVKSPAIPATVGPEAGAGPEAQPPPGLAVGFAARKKSPPVSAEVEAPPGPVFLVATVAAILVTAALIYVLAAQVIGPNDCLTPLSYYRAGPRMPWPSRIGG
jgi:hypothetical protein